MIDEYGEGLYPDLMRYYDVDLVDVINGDGPSPALVILLVRGLPDTSVTAALAAGGFEHIGWGADRHISADIYDAISQNTRATGNWGKGGPPKIPAWPRPKRKAQPTQEGTKRRSVADIYAGLSPRR